MPPKERHRYHWVKNPPGEPIKCLNFDNCNGEDYSIMVEGTAWFADEDNREVRFYQWRGCLLDALENSNDTRSDQDKAFLAWLTRPIENCHDLIVHVEIRGHP